MRCQTCSEDISSKFAAAISKNSCPYCGESIISEELQNVLAELHTVFAIATEFPDEVAEYLKDNHSLIKLADNQVVVGKEEWEVYQKKASFISSGKGQVVKRSGDGEDGEMMANADTGKTLFSQRAGVKIPTKSALDYIKGGSAGAAPMSAFNMKEDEHGNIIEGDDGGESGGEIENVQPLNNRDIRSMDDLFAPNPEEDRLVKLLELEKRRAARAPSEGEGKFRR